MKDSNLAPKVANKTAVLSLGLLGFVGSSTTLAREGRKMRRRRSARFGRTAMPASRALTGLLAAAVTGLAAAVGGAAPAAIERFSATTVAMTPRDVGLRIDIREWSSAEARAEVVAALASEDVAKALSALPTIGYVWQSSSSVGYAVKYAHRATTPEGERLTFVTDKRLGAYEFKPWAVDPPATQTDLDYSVVELYLNDRGTGTGTLSLVAGVQIDEASSLVSLAADAKPRVLANAKVEPQPYWANEG